MKKRFSFILVLFFCIAGFFALSNESLIEAAKKGDYKKFENLVLSGSDLDEISPEGLTLQCSLAYFSDKDFEKACKLLNKYKFDFNKPSDQDITLVYLLAYSYSYNKLKTLMKYKPALDFKTEKNTVTPISATQFGTFKYYSGQEVDMKNFDRAKDVRKLLMKNGSPEFESMPLSVYYFGNFLFCYYSMLKGIWPFVSLELLNTEGMFEFSQVNGQEWAAVSKETINEIMVELCFDGTIEEYTDSESICNAIKNVNESEHGYMLIAQTGNNPLCPFQWVVISNTDGFTPESNLETFCPDIHYSFMNYQMKDISMLVTIQIN